MTTEPRQCWLASLPGRPVAHLLMSREQAQAAYPEATLRPCGLATVVAPSAPRPSATPHQFRIDLLAGGQAELYERRSYGSWFGHQRYRYEYVRTYPTIAEAEAHIKERADSSSIVKSEWYDSAGQREYAW